MSTQPYIAYRAHLPGEAHGGPTLIVEEDPQTGQRVLYLHGLAALAVPLTPAVVAWLADELARVR